MEQNTVTKSYNHVYAVYIIKMHKMGNVYIT